MLWFAKMRFGKTLSALQIVKDLNEKEGVSILLAEQNTNIALKNADYAYIIETGNVMLEGSAKSLLNNEKDGIVVGGFTCSSTVGSSKLSTSSGLTFGLVMICCI